MNSIDTSFHFFFLVPFVICVLSIRGVMVSNVVSKKVVRELCYLMIEMLNVTVNRVEIS